jgi:cell division protein FtsQ
LTYRRNETGNSPDRRYWRRRANRHVRKQRRTRTLLRLALGGMAVLLLCGMFLFAGRRAVRYATESSSLAVQRIRVDGAQRCAAPALRERLQPLVGQNLLALDLRTIWREAAQDPWIRAVSVKRVLPQTLKIEVFERRPVALALIDGVAHLVDREGFVIAPCGPRHADDLPVLTGLDGGNPQALRAGLAAGARALNRLLQAQPDWARGISEIDLSHADRVTVRSIGRGPALLLDPQRVERNLEHYLPLASQIDARLGAVATIDLRWRDRITVQPGRS